MTHRWLLVLVLLLLAVACAQGAAVHRAVILDVHLGVTVGSLRVAPPQSQDVPRRKNRTHILLDITISNPSSRSLWANDCHGRAYDRVGQLLYQFSFTPGSQAGAYVGANQTFEGVVDAVVQTSEKVIDTTARATAVCAAWDWGDSPPE